uniref:SUEL-type lectin domain-containing protein n=1 Tax=Clytia hemisphaerica TaxID=252671 RepID=A0A7M5XQC1_9CNID
DSWITWKRTQCRGSEEDSDVFCRRGNYLHVTKATYGRLKSWSCSKYLKLKQEIDVTKAVQQVCHGTKKCYLYKNAKKIFKYAKSAYVGNEKHLFFNVEFKCK